MVLAAEKIKKYLQDDTSVVFGYLFGSYSDNTYTANSDVDVALFLRDLSFDNRLQISYELSKMLKKDVDLVVLNEAKNIYLMESILNNSVVIKESDKRVDFELVKLRYYLKLLNEYKPECKKKFLSDPMYEGALLHYLYLVSDGCIALAEMIIKHKSLPNPQSYYEAIDILGANSIIPKEFAYSFAKIASFRNFLAHDYEKVDYLVICDEVLNKLDDIEKYLKFLQEKICMVSIFYSLDWKHKVELEAWEVIDAK